MPMVLLSIALLLFSFTPAAHSAPQSLDSAEAFNHWAIRFSSFEAVVGSLRPPKQNGTGQFHVEKVLRGSEELAGKTIPISFDRLTPYPGSSAVQASKSSSLILFLHPAPQKPGTRIRIVAALYEHTPEIESNFRTIFPFFLHLERLSIFLFGMLMAIPIMIFLTNIRALRALRAPSSFRRFRNSPFTWVLLACGAHFFMWVAYEILFPDFFPFPRLDWLSIVPGIIYSAIAAGFFLERWSDFHSRLPE